MIYSIENFKKGLFVIINEAELERRKPSWLITSEEKDV